MRASRLCAPKGAERDRLINAVENARFSEWRLRELIMRGGIAEIWMATDKAGKAIALRLMNDSVRDSDSAPEMFVNGCKILAKLPPHRNLITYLGHGEWEETPYLLMEYVEGANLKELMLRDDSHLSELLSDILVNFAAALEHMHDHGYMHLDLKPENLILSHGGGLRLCDFDTAQPIPSKPTRLSRRSGTPNYMAPEQMVGEGVDQRADIYAFAVSAYELLTQHKPFRGDTPKEMMENQLESRYRVPPPRDYNPDIPVALERLLLKCLNFSPEMRYPNMTVVVRDLHIALGVQ